MSRTRDVVVVGGGPAGLAVAIAAAGRGLDVLVLERADLPADKPCGEGLLPAGARALELLGALVHLDGAHVSRLRSIRWIDGDVSAEARLPPPGGLGIRRTALSAALLARARALGVEVRTRTAALDHARDRSGVEIVTIGERLRARLLVAADGLNSSVRAREALERPAEGARRFGIRRHFACAPWSAAVEVHFAQGAEAYVTPVGPGQVGIAVLCEEAARASYPSMLQRFPALQRRVASAPAASPLAGAGPFPRRSLARARDRLVVVGDAAGFLDGITGDGLSLAFQSALALGAVLPDALARGAGAEAFATWAQGERRRFDRYALATRLVLALARRSPSRRNVLQLLSRHPKLSDSLVGAVVG